MNASILNRIVSEVGTPVYLYDKQWIMRRLDQMTAIEYPNTTFYAATMANSNPTLLQLYKKHGFGAFVNSIKHMRHGMSNGFRGSDIMWTSTGMNERQIRASIDKGTLLNLDSVNQVALYGKINPGGKVGVRINIGDMPNNETYAGTFVGKTSRIGILPEEFNSLDEVVKQHNLTIIGLHVYLGTQIHDVDHFRRGIEQLLEISSRFRDIEYLDLGGGVGICDGEDAEFDFAKYNSTLTDIMKRVSKEYCREIKLILEPGRILAGDAGYFVTRVTDVKYRNNKPYVFVDASSTIFTRPLFYPDLPNHPHYVLGKENEDKFQDADIYGSTTYSRDYLARSSRNIPKDIAIGDIVVFVNAGSYCFYSKTDFLGIETPPQVLVDGMNYTVITTGER